MNIKLIAGAAAASMLFLAGCQTSESANDKAGDAAESMVEETGEAMEATGDAIKEGADAVSESMQETAEDAAEAAVDE